MYNKFRAVESILAVAMLCFPVLAFMAVEEVYTNKDKAYIFKYLKIAFYITGGILLILIAIPDVFLSFKTDQHQNIIAGLTQAFRGDSGMANSIANGLVQDRISMERADAIRSLIFIAIAFGILWAFIKQKINVTATSIAFIVIVLIDMWGVDRRYLNDTNFVHPS